MRLAERDVPGSSPRADGDNAVRLSSGPPPRALLSYCRGLFRCIAEAPGGLERASRAFAADPRLDLGVDARGKGPRSFVLRSFGPDDPAAIPLELRREIETRIERATGMRPDSERPEREYRLQERADGRTLFLERMVSLPETATRAGELPRTTCRLLAEMTEPKADDVFLDPFCGYGGIALERALASPYRFVFAADTDAAKVAVVKESLSLKAFEKRRKTLFPKLRDALDASTYESGFVNAIATDPPWGLFEGGMGKSEAEALLSSFLVEAARLLPPNGRLVLLVARGLDLAGGLVGSDFVLKESLDVLVSGKKARVLHFDRA
jgi:SAM-dependent methyltransferase